MGFILDMQGSLNTPKSIYIIYWYNKKQKPHDHLIHREAFYKIQYQQSSNEMELLQLHKGHKKKKKNS